MSSERGNLIIVSAASGSGKSTLVDQALTRLEGAERCVTCTTRAPRGTEVDGVDYHFLSLAEFERRIEAQDFLEYARVHGDKLYGTSRSSIEDSLSRGIDVFLVIDVQGAESVRLSMPDAVSIFILPPSRAALEQRLRSRSAAQNHNDESDLACRLESARREVHRYTEFGYVIVNDDRERAVDAMVGIVLAERCRGRGQREKIEEILNTFHEGEETTHA
jgi:guanylate kinase